MQVTPNSEGERALTGEDPKLTLYENNSEGENDPMISKVINPLSAQVEIIVPHLRVKGKSLIDSGCT